MSIKREHEQDQDLVSIRIEPSLFMELDLTFPPRKLISNIYNPETDEWYSIEKWFEDGEIKEIRL